jgi:hypothetical protein
MYLPPNVLYGLLSVNLTALSGGTGPTLVVGIQQQDANGNWVNIAATASQNAAGQASAWFGPGLGSGVGFLLSGQPYRLAWTVTGTPATCTFQVGVTGRRNRQVAPGATALTCITSSTCSTRQVGRPAPREGGVDGERDGKPEYCLARSR